VLGRKQERKAHPERGRETARRETREREAGEKQGGWWRRPNAGRKEIYYSSRRNTGVNIAVPTHATIADIGGSLWTTLPVIGHKRKLSLPRQTKKRMFGKRAYRHHTNIPFVEHALPAEDGVKDHSKAPYVGGFPLISLLALLALVPLALDFGLLLREPDYFRCHVLWAT